MMMELTQAAQDVLAERERQIEGEGWTSKRDDLYTNGSLAKAAATYAIGATLSDAERATMDEFGLRGTPYRITVLWPWDWKWWKPKNRRRDLVKAGALILAEIERLDRARVEAAVND